MSEHDEHYEDEPKSEQEPEPEPEHEEPAEEEGTPEEDAPALEEEPEPEAAQMGLVHDMPTQILKDNPPQPIVDLVHGLVGVADTESVQFVPAATFALLLDWLPEHDGQILTKAGVATPTLRFCGHWIGPAPVLVTATAPST